MLPVMATKKTKNTKKVLKHQKTCHKKTFFTSLFPVYHFSEGKFSINETKTAISNISGSDHAIQNSSNCIR